MKKLFLIGGTMGVGKTTICQSLKKELQNCVFLDGDWCWNANPFQVTEETKRMVINNICHLLNSFIKCSAYDNIIFCWVMHEQKIIDTILDNLDVNNCEIKSISLTADESTIKDRLMQDVIKGIRTTNVIERSIARIPLYSKLNTIKIDTSNKSLEMILKEIESL